jgi:REP-associated tyrosine transposase
LRNLHGLRADVAGFQVKAPGSVLANRGAMSRRERLFMRGMALHVTQRGNNRTVTFRRPSDYEMFLLFVRLATRRYSLRLHAYALMPNHFHLIVTPESPEQLSRSMQSLGRRYVRFFNDRYERTGTLWEGRYRTAVIANERYWLACLRYVEMNPVRAGIVVAPELYRWSSYRSHALGTPNDLLASHSIYEGLGNSPDRRQQAWRRICGQAVTDEQLEVLRKSIRNGFVAGEPFVQEYAESAPQS